MFHVSPLKKVVGQHPIANELQNGLEVEKDKIEPKAILQMKGPPNIQFQHCKTLVQWKGKLEEEAAWLDYIDFVNQFPYFLALWTRLFSKEKQ